ncbi:MAG: UDP-2,3-diacylglucosamine diphosphatase LpxI [bacterium]|nr:UDP-2,3-diacylglucosamine diphosphatase LpxI [bacterium]
MISDLIKKFFTTTKSDKAVVTASNLSGIPFGLIAGNGPFPFEFVRGAQAAGYCVYAVCHLGQTSPELEEELGGVCWIRVGELGRMIDAFSRWGVKEVAMAGGINRVSIFGGVRPDRRALALLGRLRTTKDDIIMRGVADELAAEGITVVSCTRFMQDSLASEGVLTKRAPSEEQLADIEVGRQAIRAMSEQHIGQTVCVREGVVVAVEAVEGTDAAISRGSRLGGPGTVVVKCAKTTQDMRFDVPTVGLKTLQGMKQGGATVLALEAGRSLLLERNEVIAFADRNRMTIVGIPPLV